MASDGHAIVCLRRVLASPAATAAQIRSVAAELPRIGLEDALAILLACWTASPRRSHGGRTVGFAVDVGAAPGAKGPLIAPHVM